MNRVIRETTNFINKYYKKISVIFILIFIIQVFLYGPRIGQSPVFTVQYFSGAKLFNIDMGWRFDKNEAEKMKSLKGYDIYTYQFDNPRKAISTYNENSSGLLYVIIFAEHIFPFLGPIGALVLLQIIIHLICCFIIYFKLKRPVEKTLFLLLYFINPIVVYFVIFPMYYFWTIIPSVIFLYYYINSKTTNLTGYIITAILCFIGYAIRPTVLPLLLLIPGYNYFKTRNLKPLIAFPVYLILFFGWNHYLNFTKNYTPWHTMFVGVGAYPNNYPYLQKLSDNEGFDRYASITGLQVSNSIDGNYHADSIRNDYSRIIENEYLKIVKESPLLIVRNGLLNYLQSFSAGYKTKTSFLVNILISLSGLILILLLIKFKKWPLLIAISFSAISFTPYYPPIPAYMYGSFILIAYSIISVIYNLKFLREGAVNN